MCIAQEHESTHKPMIRFFFVIEWKRLLCERMFFHTISLTLSTSFIFLSVGLCACARVANRTATADEYTPSPYLNTPPSYIYSEVAYIRFANGAKEVVEMERYIVSFLLPCKSIGNRNYACTFLESRLLCA